jgi:hypothetical protein
MLHEPLVEATPETATSSPSTVTALAERRPVDGGQLAEQLPGVAVREVTSRPPRVVE